MSAPRRIIQDWFEVWEVEPGVHAIGEPFHFERVHSYLIEGLERALLFDTGMGVGDIKAVVDEITKLPYSVLNSHAHWDHVGGNWRFEDIAIHEAEAADLTTARSPGSMAKWFTSDFLSAPLPSGTTPESIEIKASRANTLLRGGEVLDLGGRTLEIVLMPGHSAGGIVGVDHENGLLFTTDLAYLAPLYAYAPSTNVLTYRDSLARLEVIASGMRLALPSHDQTPFDPALISDMCRAFDVIIDGRAPDEMRPEMAVHRFQRFGVYVPTDFGQAGGNA